MSGQAIQSIAVAGDGIVGRSAALAFARSLPKTRVTIIECPADPAALADVLPTAWPTIGRFHSTIGLDELDLVRDGIATHHLGTVVGCGNETWVHAFAPHGKPVGAVQFDQVWLRAKEAGRAREYEAYSAAAVLARAGKFVHPSRDPDSLLANFAYGLRLDPKLYRTRLLDVAATAGIQRVTGELDRIESDGERILAVSLSGATRIEADLFLDCSGPGGRLIGTVDESFEDWPHLADSVIIEEVEGRGATSAAFAERTPSGWTTEWPLADRTLRCSIGSGLPHGIRIRPGRRARPWASNVLALGDAATAVPPIHGLNLDLAHRAILLALELLPGRDFSPLELAEYNRRSALMTDQVRDFIALHDVRDDEEGLRGNLARRVDQYRHRGRLPFQEDEVLNRDDWTAALIGLECLPRNVDPAAAEVPLDRAVEAMDQIADELARFAAGAPQYRDYLQRIAALRR